MKELKNEKINLPYSKIRKCLYPLSIHPFNLIAIQRSNFGENGKILRFILEDQNKNEFQRIIKQRNIKLQQKEGGIRLLQQKTGMNVDKLRQVMGDGWTIKVRIFYILSNKFSNRPVSVKNALEVLKDNSITISRQNLLRYLTPFSRESFSLLEIERTKKGDNSPVKCFVFV